MARDEFHLILNVTGGNVIRLLPALNISDADTAVLIEKLLALLAKVLN
jgi:acetylornithine aminotransferase